MIIIVKYKYKHKNSWELRGTNEKFIIEPEYDGYEIGTYLKETKGYSGRGLRNIEIYLNGKRVKNNSKKVRKLNRTFNKGKRQGNWNNT